MTRNSITVIVCAYNQSDKLDHCLHSLLEARPPSGWHRDVIVVDNNSTDDTAEVVERHRLAHGNELTYLKEPRQGKCFALNQGIAACDSEVIAFTDQDCLAPTDWYDTIVQEFQNDPELHVVGGRVELHNAKDAKTTVRTSMERRTIGSNDIEATYIPIVGCNVAVRREVFSKIGLFDTAFGPGSSLPAAEDLDMLHRMTAAGLRVVYVPELVIYHDHGRSDEATLKNLARAYAVSRGGYYGKYMLRLDRLALRSAYNEMWPLVTAILRRPFGKSTRRKRRHLSALLTGVRRYALSMFRRQPEPVPNSQDKPSSRIAIKQETE